MLPVDEADLADVEPQLLTYLNSRGSALGLQEALADPTAAVVDGRPVPVKTHVFTKDVTGDATPDVVMDLVIPNPDYEGVGVNMIFAFVCRDGHYETAFRQHATVFLLDYYPNASGLQAIEDMNGDGVPEIIYSFLSGVGSNASYGIDFDIREWKEDGFVDLIEPTGFNGYPPLVGGRGFPDSSYKSAYEVTDIDGNGTFELVLIDPPGGDLAMGDYYFYDPPRTSQYIWAWNGRAFVLARIEPAPLWYRIQAVRDGDAVAQAGNYTKALALYQQAIFDESLLGWCSFEVFNCPDPNERPRLSAYSRYRIMLLYIVQGHLSDAQTVYNTLQSKFPADVAGHPYAQLAAAFWKKYQSSQNIVTACAQAMEYASTHTDDILTPLGHTVYGVNYHDYAPEDICPFK